MSGWAHASQGGLVPCLMQAWQAHHGLTSEQLMYPLVLSPWWHSSCSCYTISNGHCEILGEWGLTASLLVVQCRSPFPSKSLIASSVLSQPMFPSALQNNRICLSCLYQSCLCGQVLLSFPLYPAQILASVGAPCIFIEEITYAHNLDSLALISNSSFKVFLLFHPHCTYHYS